MCAAQSSSHLTLDFFWHFGVHCLRARDGFRSSFIPGASSFVFVPWNGAIKRLWINRSPCAATVNVLRLPMIVVGDESVRRRLPIRIACKLAGQFFFCFVVLFRPRAIETTARVTCLVMTCAPVRIKSHEQWTYFSGCVRTFSLLRFFSAVLHNKTTHITA